MIALLEIVAGFELWRKSFFDCYMIASVMIVWCWFIHQTVS